MHHGRQATRLLAAPILVGALLLGSCAKRYPHGRGLIGQLEAEVVGLHRKVRALEKQALTCDNGEAPTSLYQQLVQVFPSSSDVKVEFEHQRVRVIVPWSKAFTDEGTVALRGQMALDLLSSVLNNHGAHHLLVIGHASPGETSRQDGFQRADVIATELTTRFNVTEDRLVPGSGTAAAAPYLEIVLLPLGEATVADE